MVGFIEVLWQIPRDVTIAPPSEVTFPPLDAVVSDIGQATVVLTIGIVKALPASLMQRKDMPPAINPLDTLLLPISNHNLQPDPVLDIILLQ